MKIAIFLGAGASAAEHCPIQSQLFVEYFKSLSKEDYKFEMNKASGGDEIPVELFQILKDDAVKLLHSICQQIWKTEQWPQDWKSSVFINPKERQFQRMFKVPHNCIHLTR